MSAAVLLLATLLGAIALAVQLLDRRLREGPGGERRVQGARWARRRDLRELRVEGPQKGRVTLGRHGRNLLAAEERASVLIVGPTTISMKTVGLAVPALLEWEGPAIVTSVKSDLLEATIKRREQLGKTMVFDPSGATKRRSVKATPLWACKSWGGALRVAHRLSTSARVSGSGGLEDAEFWHAAAEKLLAPLLYAAARDGRQMGDVIRWLNEESAAQEEVASILAQAPDSPAALSAWQANWNREERTRSSIYTTAETILTAFADPRVLKVSDRAGYKPAALLNGKSNTLYLCAPAHEQKRLRSLFAAMVSELVAAAYERSAKTGKPLDPPLLVLLDEAANTAPIPDLDVLASSGAGQGIQLLSVFQDLAQVRAKYGKHAQTIFNNHRAKVFCPGIADPDTIRFISQVIGDGEFRHSSETAGTKGHTSSTEQSTYRELVPPNVLRGGEEGSGLLIAGNRPPARIVLRPWFDDRQLTALVKRGTLRDD
ncbi:MAG: type IV secretory system conjugative DNA transfer family protein [Thermoleophilia bacterium]